MLPIKSVPIRRFRSNQSRFGASDQISPDSARDLKNLAKALLSDKLATERFVVAGHTDATGSAAYNQTLSERRAASVLRFLSAQGVDSQRLQSEGRGERELLYRQNPAAPKNRRVEIIKLAR
jgi:outer membrane protein OmpA-like peptidoglycan-associated protein